MYPKKHRPFPLFLRAGQTCCKCMHIRWHSPVCRLTIQSGPLGKMTSKPDQTNYVKGASELLQGFYCFIPIKAKLKSKNSHLCSSDAMPASYLANADIFSPVYSGCGALGLLHWLVQNNVASVHLPGSLFILAPRHPKNVHWGSMCIAQYTLLKEVPD